MYRRTLPAIALLTLACGGLGPIDYGDCPDYLDCAAGMGMPTASLEASYGEEGVCWEEEEHVLCRAACTDGLEITCPEGVDDTGGGAGCGEVVGTGNAEGQVAHDFEVQTQVEGETFRLHAHCDEVVLIVTGAMWDGGTAGEIEDLEALHLAKEDAGLRVLLLLAENATQETPTQRELLAYAEHHGASFVVAADPDWAIENRFRSDNGIPSFTLIDRGGVVVAADAWDARDKIDGLL